MPHTTLLISDPAMLAHEGVSGHPENPHRLRAIFEELRTHPVDGVRWTVPQSAPRAALERAHDPAYLDRIEQARGRTELFDWDTATSSGSVHAAELSAGAVIDAIDAVTGGQCEHAFALGRPPGHHAESDRAMGFCFFSNVAIGTLHAIEACGVERVLVFDWDVHHGNGTQHILENRADALFISMHQHPLFPGTGWVTETGFADAEGRTVNLPMPAGCGDAEYLGLMDEVVVPIANSFEPDLVIVSAGYDAHAGDPLGGMEVSTEGFRAMCARTRAIAERHAGGRLVLALEGGYNLAALAASVRACVEDLTGHRRADLLITPPRSETVRVIAERVRSTHERAWGRALGAG